MAQGYQDVGAVRVRVRLINPAPSCAEAVERTLKDLPGGACSGFERDAGGAIVIADGCAWAHTSNPKFLKFACEAQGYAREVIL